MSGGVDIKTIMHPSEDTCLHCTREYLKRAKQAYAEAGGTYTLSKSEQKTADIDANMGSISKTTLASETTLMATAAILQN